MIPNDQTSSLSPKIDYRTISGLKYKGLPGIHEFFILRDYLRHFPNEMQSKSETLAIP